MWYALIIQSWTVLEDTQEGTWNPGITCLFPIQIHHHQLAQGE